ncbi:MAG: DNA topoisomerase I [Candidatus Marinimicrobia bacterium]|nr:DNA topoisomerase I [Candidatus Neomarinimicrobiota bacterium]
MSQRPLLVVESPSKARTIEQYLGGDFEVIASVGHIKDLPSNELGIDIENNFKIDLHPLSDRKKFIDEIKSKSQKAPRVLIATDPDREGEAIAAHIASEVPSEKTERVEFTEITKAGISDAMKNIRQIDKNLVDAQTARRIIDRLVGYKVSPVLWATLKKNMNFVSGSLSAGRVQSAAVKLLIDRERLRARFQSTTYFDILAKLEDKKEKISFDALLISYDEKTVASSKSFESETGKIKSSDVLLLDEPQVSKIFENIDDNNWSVVSVEEKPRASNPKPPFTTSTLQQEAARKLRMSARQTMRNAQILYENGFITYMRTDSTHLSEEAIGGSRKIIGNLYGEKYLPNNPNIYENKVRNAQEAHEAIRPAHREFRTIDEVQSILGEDCAKLYDLIWKRTIASQMPPAKLKQTTINIKNNAARFRANGQVIIFPGYMKIYVEGQDNPDAELTNNEKILPVLKKDDHVLCKERKKQSHTTKPPARFTEASLVKALEGNGIGRPSTFASIMDTIVKRGYVDRKNSRLIPTYLGLAVTQLLENHFSNLVNKEFTAKMEDGLDEISRGERKSLPFINNFYFGGEENIFVGLEKMLEEKIDIPLACTIEIPESIQGSTEARIGRYGPFLRRGEITRSIPDLIYLGDLNLENIEQIFKEKLPENKSLGKDPKTNSDIWIKKGPYGNYVQLGDTKTRKSIPKGTPINDINLELALKLFALPRTIGKHPETNEIITADYGRYGPYIKCGKQNASLRGKETPLDITLDKAIEFLINKNKKSSEIRSLGIDPETKNTIVLKDGRYGPYISDGKINASLGQAYTTDTITLETAIELIKTKKSAPKRKRKRKKKK